MPCVLLSVIIFSACSVNANKELESELNAISRSIESKKTTRMKKEIDEIRLRFQENDTNISMIEKSLSNAKSTADDLEPRFSELGSAIEKSIEGKKNKEKSLPALKSEIESTAEEISRMNKKDYRK